MCAVEERRFAWAESTHLTVVRRARLLCSLSTTVTRTVLYNICRSFNLTALLLVNHRQRFLAKKKRDNKKYP
jgi:hypothetical protein